MRQLLCLFACGLAPCLLQAQSADTDIQRLLDESQAQSNQQHYDAAIQLAQQAIGLSDSRSDKASAAKAYFAVGNAYYNKQSLAEAVTALKQAETHAMEIGDANLRGRATTVMGSALRDQGKLEEALGYYDRALDIFRTTADPRGQARVIRMMGLIYRLTGDLDRADVFCAGLVADRA